MGERHTGLRLAHLQNVGLTEKAGKKGEDADWVRAVERVLRQGEIDARNLDLTFPLSLDLRCCDTLSSRYSGTKVHPHCDYRMRERLWDEAASQTLLIG